MTDNVSSKADAILNAVAASIKDGNIRGEVVEAINAYGDAVRVATLQEADANLRTALNRLADEVRNG